jgi:tetratricopeptide (TPR) repeat protein
VICLVVGFAGGFVLANFLNRSEISRLEAEAKSRAAAPAGQQTGQQGSLLTDEEINAKLKEAEQNADNFAFQKALGLGLYRYGTLRNDTSVIERAIPVLERANSLNPDDYDVIVGLGNAWFDVGYLNKENPPLEKAREFYRKALEKRPGDVDVRTDLGLTYFLYQPPDRNAAIAEFRRSLSESPKHERTLQAMIETLRADGKDASEFIERLRAVNPKNTLLSEQTGPTGQMPLSDPASGAVNK